MVKNLEISVLFDFYRNVLTEKQADVIDLYYNEDLSLAEIAEHLDITRQGVRDNIKRAETAMIELEKNLGLVKRYTAVKNTVSKIREEISEMEITDSADSAHIEKIKSLLMQIEE